MSTLGQPHLEPAWKQEVSRRIAAHKNRKTTPAETPAEHSALGGSRAAEAAARVAARYAKAPSYSQMQAEEARVAVRAAEIATQVALEAQAVAESALAELHAAATETPRGPAVVESISKGRPEAAQTLVAEEPPAPKSEPQQTASAPHFTPEVETQLPDAEEIHTETVVSTPPPPQPIITHQVVNNRTVGIRWEPDTPVRVLQPRQAPQPMPFELAAEDWWTPAEAGASLRDEPIAVDFDHASANLLEFPRELVAPRRMRPRLLEPAAAVSEAQLSIFEVDPGAVSTDPWSETEAVPDTADEWSPLPSADSTAGPRWSGMQLDEYPQPSIAIEPETETARHTIFLAPLGHRLLSLVVDGALILGCFLGGATAILSRMSQLPAARTAELLTVLGIVLAGFLYHTFFFALRVSTPGMLYAGVALSTFDDESPTRVQLRRRLGAMALSLLPVGLGFAWSVFDEDHLSWHDRISQTYLRKR